MLGTVSTYILYLLLLPLFIDIGNSRRLPGWRRDQIIKLL